MFLPEIFVITVRLYYFVSFNSKYFSTRGKAKFESWIKQKPFFYLKSPNIVDPDFYPTDSLAPGTQVACLFHNKVWKSKQQNTEIIDTGKKEIAQFDEYHQFGYGISLIVGPKKQDFWRKINVGKQRKPLYFVNTSPNSFQ